ncbi:MAG: hypothetical protein JO090_00495, partial [Rhizobacter sp.]|nr:hypothetical protein [Rhizobacter sp.]
MPVASSSLPESIEPLVGDAVSMAPRTARKPESAHMHVAPASTAERVAVGPVANAPTEADVRRLYDHAGATTAAGIAIALCVWLL